MRDGWAFHYSTSAVLVLRSRTKGGVFRTIRKVGLNSRGSRIDVTLRPFIIIPPNSDIEMCAEANGAGTPISAGFDSILAIKV